ncbi:hypothetical protein F8388_009574 [Cannabis sativa]|uniref:Uncharacterized protein n=2 Tax=Cannabis sativa TaxID=3483 RepID=A0A7J6H782_CANSA|nr:hypothetical protein F8388_009574 [Cannabis sativa]
MLVVLGDVSAIGWELNRPKMVVSAPPLLGPFLNLPLHIVLGNRDLRRCGKLNQKSINWVARGCGTFKISNVSFVSLNVMALLCGNDGLRFSVEKVIERENVDVRTERGAF